MHDFRCSLLKYYFLPWKYLCLQVTAGCGACYLWFLSFPSSDDRPTSALISMSLVAFFFGFDNEIHLRARAFWDQKSVFRSSPSVHFRVFWSWMIIATFFKEKKMNQARLRFGNEHLKWHESDWYSANDPCLAAFWSSVQWEIASRIPAFNGGFYFIFFSG